MTHSAMGSMDFFRLVDELLTPQMAELGYHPLGGIENDQPRSRASLATSGADSPGEADLGGESTFLVYDFGYEAGSENARRLVTPMDPETAVEVWLSYEPATGELDLRAWTFLDDEALEWDPRTGSGPCTVSEVRRRLRGLGRAVAHFARSHREQPPTS